MEAVKKLEKTIEGWLKPVPHLPSEWRKWLAENVWWLVLVGVILSVFAAFAALGAIITALSFMGAATSFYGYYYTQTYSGWWFIASIISMVSLVITITLTVMAVNPLKEHKKKGWDLLFMAALVGLSLSLVSTVVSFNVVSFIPSLIGLAIGAFIGMYFLYEIRSHFNAATVVHKTK